MKNDDYYVDVTRPTPPIAAFSRDYVERFLFWLSLFFLGVNGIKYAVGSEVDMVMLDISIDGLLLFVMLWFVRVIIWKYR